MSWLDEGASTAAGGAQNQEVSTLIAPPETTPVQEPVQQTATSALPARQPVRGQLPAPPLQPRTGAPTAASGVPALDTKDGFEWVLRQLAMEGVSDVHFIGGGVAWMVRFGRPVKTTLDVPNEVVVAWAEAFAGHRGGGRELLDGPSGNLEVMSVVGPVGARLRLRMAFRRQATGVALTVRIVPEKPPRLTDAVFHRGPVPQALVDLALHSPAGLILFCGPTGSGKTTVTAALLAEVNNTQNKHIYTIEDPIEFIHESTMSVITQREIGVHADSFAGALRAAMRARPDIILIGELLDLDTVRVAVEAANKGHLVFATSHASSAEEAVSSLVSQFPGSEQNQVATALSQALKAVMVQRLVPAVDGQLVPARELLLNSVPVAAKIRGMTFSAISQALRPTDGMWAFEDDLAMLWAQGQIDEATAFSFCNSFEEMTRKLDYARGHREETASGANRGANRGS